VGSLISATAFALVPCMLPLAAANISSNGPLIVVMEAGVPAYQEALNGLRSGLGHRQVHVIHLPSSGENPVLPEGTESSSVIVAFGSRSARAASAIGKNASVVASMILDDEPQMPTMSEAGARPVAIISLDMPFAAVMKSLTQLFPGTRRVALLHGGSRPDARLAEWQTQARALGVTLRLVRCSRPKDLLDSLSVVRNEVDFVWSLPDASLYNPAIISPLVLESIRRRLPIIGFSENFVRAGATVGFYPDYLDIGVQTAEVVAMVENGRPVPIRQGPRKFKAGVNVRVLRLLGLEYHRESAGKVEVIR
jgi:putative tryptophan/tyrosine transport system substrate-binding protein